MQEDLNNEKYPPLFELAIVWYVTFGFSIQVECYLQIAPGKIDK
jgi:hypothetical protein